MLGNFDFDSSSDEQFSDQRENQIIKRKATNFKSKSPSRPALRKKRPSTGPNVIGNAEDESLLASSSEYSKMSPAKGPEEEEKEHIIVSDLGENDDDAEDANQSDSSTNFLRKILQRTISKDSDSPRKSAKRRDTGSAKRSKQLASSPSNQARGAKEKEEFEQIEEMFSREMQQIMRQRPVAQQRERKIPRYLQSIIGEATNLYAFQRYDEAIPLFEQVIKKMPELADISHTMSLIYQEKGDLERAFGFALLSANETRTDSEKWLQCADLSIKLVNYKNAIYCYNRAAKALNEETQYMDILDIKMAKINLYKKKRDYVSITRTIDKQIKFFQNLQSSEKKKHKDQIEDPEEHAEKIKRISSVLHELQSVQYETLHRQGHTLKSLEILGRLISEKANNVEKLHDLGIYAKRGIEIGAFDAMRDMWNVQKSAILKHLGSTSKHRVPVLLQASAFQAMCSFKIAFIAREESVLIQNQTVQSVMSFTSFLQAGSDAERRTKAWARAVTIITSSLLQLGTFLNLEDRKDANEQIKLKLLHHALELAGGEQGEKDVSQEGNEHLNALDRARILQVLGSEMQKGGDAKFVDIFEGALDDCRRAETQLQKLSSEEELANEHDMVNVSNMLSEIVAILIKEYYRRGQPEKVRDLINKHSKATNAGGDALNEQIEYQGYHSIYTAGSARSPLKDRRLLKFERHNSQKVSRTLRLTQSVQAKLPMEQSMTEEELKLRVVKFDCFRQRLALQELKMLMSDFEGENDSNQSQLDVKNKFMDLVSTCLFASLDHLGLVRRLQSLQKQKNTASSNEPLLKDSGIYQTQPSQLKSIPNILSEKELVETTVKALTFLAKFDKTRLAKLLAERVMALKDLFLPPTASLACTSASNPSAVGQHKTLSQLLCSILLETQLTSGESHSSQTAKKSEMAFRLALEYLPSVETWPWLVINRVLCQTTGQPARHKNLLRNLKYKLFGALEGSSTTNQSRVAQNPFYLLTQANSQIQRDNVNLKCLPRYWRVRSDLEKLPLSKSEKQSTAALLDLALFCTLVRQVFNRREPEKDSKFRQAMAFLVSYSANRKQSNPIEARYNIARAFHYLGMNTHAQKLYEQILDAGEASQARVDADQEDELASELQEMRTRARFNLSQILKGSGLSLGITVRGVNESSNSNVVKMGAQETKRVKYNSVWNAHKAIMNNVI